MISSVAPGQASFGDTIVVSGSSFSRNLADNRIVVSQGQWNIRSARREIVPFAGSSSELRGVLPDGTFTGAVRVENCSSMPGFPLLAPDFAVASSSLPLGVRLSEGQVGKAFFSSFSYEFEVEVGSSNDQYLVVLFSDATPPTSSWSYIYEIAARNATSSVSASERSKSKSKSQIDLFEKLDAKERTALLHCGPLWQDFEVRKNEEIRRILQNSRSSLHKTDHPVHHRENMAGAVIRATFKVLRGVNLPIGDPASYLAVTADLEFEGAHTLLYVDTATTPENLTHDEAVALGRAFDERIYENNRATFGEESDINGDGKVVILMSPAVNRLTDPGTAPTQGFIAGYFLQNDLLPHLVPAGATNAMEIFYTVVPDPTGQYGNVFTKDKVLPVIEGVLSHEFLHMILFNYRALIYGQAISGAYLEELWLEEGLAHIAEDVNGYVSSNIARAKLFLADPGNVTLIYGGDSLEERGASFLFLRLIGDRFGSSIFRTLVQSKKTGVSNIEAATGEFFLELFADWSAALYLSGRGITDDPRFNYTSIDLLRDFRAPYVASGVLGPLDGSMKSMAPEYILYELPASAVIEFEIAGESQSRLNAVVARLR